MADLNALIAQGYQFQPLPDPFVQYGKMQQLQQGEQSNQLNQLKIQEAQRSFAEHNALRGLDPTSPTYLSDVTRISPKLGFEFGKLRQEGENAKLEYQTKNAALLKHKIDFLPEAYARADTPAAYIRLHETIHADPILGPWLDSIGSTKEQGRAKIDEAIQNGTFDQLRTGSMQSVADIKDQMGNVAYAREQGAGGPVAAAPAVVQQGEGAGPIRESAPSSALVTPQATNAMAPPAINALAAVSPADKFKDRIKAIDAEVARGNSNPAFNKSTAWADTKKRLEEERKSLMLSADQQIRMTTPNPQETRLGNVVITRDMNPNSPTYGKEIQPRQEIGLTADQELKKTTPNPVQTRLGNVVITRDMNPNSPTYLKEIQPREEIGLTAQQELAKTTPNPVDTRLGDVVETRDMNPNSPTYNQVISRRTINMTLNEQYNQTAPKPVDTRLGDQVVTRDMNPGSPTYGQVISKQTINQTLNEQYTQTAPKPVDTRLGDVVVTRDMNPGSPTYGQVISKQTIGFSAEQALNNTLPKPEQINDGKQIYFIDKNPNSPTYGQRTGAPAVSVQMTPGQEASNRVALSNLGLSRERLTLSKAQLDLAQKRFAEEFAGTKFNPETIDMMAQMYLQTGNLPAVGQGRKGAEAKALILNKANEIQMAVPGATAASAASEVIGAKQDVAAQTATLKDFSSGPSARRTTSISTALNHLETMDKLANALNNSDVKAFNYVANQLAEQTGSPAPTNIDAAAQIVGAEVIKAIVANGGSAKEREEAKATFSKIKSPAQLKGASDTYRELLGGQLTTLAQQYETGTGRKDFNQKLSPAAVKLLKPNAPAAGAVDTNNKWLKGL